MGAIHQALLSFPGAAAGGGAPSTNLAFEHRADDLTAGNNNAIATWVSHPPTSNNLSQGTGANKPTQRDNTLNGLPTAQFDGNDIMDLATPISAGSGTNFTYFAVMKCTDGGACTLAAGSGGSPQIRIDGLKINVLRATTDDMGHSSTSLTSGVYYTIAASYDGTTVRFYLNGAADGTNTTSKTFVDPIRYMGARDGNEFFLGNIAHQLLYTDVKSGGDLTDVFDYLRGIWATW